MGPKREKSPKHFHVGASLKFSAPTPSCPIRHATHALQMTVATVTVDSGATN